MAGLTTGLAWLRRLAALRRSSPPRDPYEIRYPYAIRALAGTNVTPDTALALPAVWGCVKYISESLASMPWRVMQRTEGGSEIAESHPVDWLLHAEPNGEWTAFQFVESLVIWALVWGNGYAEIERGPSGLPAALWPLPPYRVTPYRDVETGILKYQVDAGTKGTVYLAAEDVFHLRGFGHDTVGISPVELLAQTIGWARAVSLFGAAFFGNGMSFSGIFQQTGRLGEAELKRFRAEAEAKYRGPWKAFRALFSPMGIEWKDMGIAPDKGQFIQTAQFLIDEVCRIFAVPPHIVAELSRSTNNNIEQQSIEAVQRCLMPWVRRMELEANRKLFGKNRRGYFTKMNMSALLRGDAAARSTLLRALFDMGAISPNEIRELEDMNRLGMEGDKHLVQLNLTTLDKAGEQSVASGGQDNLQPDPAALNALRAIELMLEHANV